MGCLGEGLGWEAVFLEERGRQKTPSRLWHMGVIVKAKQLREEPTMPRTIESLLDSHHAATERRAAGKPIWDRRIRIKHLLADDESAENAKAVGKEIAKVVRASTWAKADQAEAEEGGGDSEVAMCAEEFEDVDDLDHFNSVLARLYDLADADRTWIE